MQDLLKSWKVKPTPWKNWKRKVVDVDIDIAHNGWYIARGRR